MQAHLIEAVIEYWNVEMFFLLRRCVKMFGQRQRKTTERSIRPLPAWPAANGVGQTSQLEFEYNKLFHLRAPAIGKRYGSESHRSPVRNLSYRILHLHEGGLSSRCLGSRFRAVVVI